MDLKDHLIYAAVVAHARNGGIGTRPLARELRRAGLSQSTVARHLWIQNKLGWVRQDPLKNWFPSPNCPPEGYALMPKSHFEFISGLALKSGALAVALVMTASFAVMFLVGVVPTPQAFYVSGVILAGLIVAARAEGKILVTELALIYLVKMFRGFALSA